MASNAGSCIVCAEQEPLSPLSGSGEAQARGWTDGLTLAGLALFAALIQIINLVTRPQTVLNGDFLVGDQGTTLLAAQDLMNGRMLYADCVYPYGWASAGSYVAWASIFGNTARAYVGFQVALNFVEVLLLYCAARRALTAVWAGMFTAIAMLPEMLYPGSVLGAYAGNPAAPLERIVLTGLVLIWVVPSRRSRSQSAVIGGFLALLQWIKFGSGIFIGLAVVVLDLVCLYADRHPGRSIRRWMIGLMTTLGVACMGEIIRALFSLWMLPTPIALDVIFPLYAARLYAAQTAVDRTPFEWFGLGHFVVQQFPLLLGLFATLAGIVLWVRSSGRFRQGSVALLIPGLFFIVAQLGYIGHVHHYFHYGWTVTLAGALVCSFSPRTALVFLALMLPSFAIMLRATLTSPVSTASEFALPNGDRLYLPEEAQNSLRRITQRLRSEPSADDRNRVLIVPLGAGFHFYYDVPRFSRHTWYIPYYPRPYDDANLIEAIDHTRFVIVITDQPVSPGELPAELRNELVIRPAVAARLFPRLSGPIDSGPGWVLFRVE
jgi:hypothetical protein